MQRFAMCSTATRIAPSERSRGAHWLFATAMLLCGLPAQVADTAPDPPHWRGPGDVVGSTPLPSASGPRPAAPPAMTPPIASPRPSGTPAHLRLVPPQIARALVHYGAPLELKHERTARSRLTYAWESVKVVQPPREGYTVAPYVPRALPLEAAAARVADGDPRPQLILRECWRTATSGAVDIGRKLANEKTILLAKWFRCVRVSDSVRHVDHPLHALFAAPDAPHLVLCAADGSGLVSFRGNESLSVLWAAMHKLLRQSVDGDVDAAVAQELEILSRYDHLDSLENDLATRLDQALETLGPKARESVELRERLAELGRERAAVEAREARVMGLPLRGPTPRR